MARTILAVIFTAVACWPAAGSEADAKKALLMQTHWQCSTWASMHADSAAVERHFTAGLQAGNIFMDAAIAGTITKEEADGNVPFMVTLTMQGPNKDFVLGRLFEGIQGDAYDRITTRGTDGLPLNPSDYITEDELVETLSRTQYSRANCELL